MNETIVVDLLARLVTTAVICLVAGFMAGIKFGIWLEDKFDMRDGYNYHRIRTPGGKIINLPKRDKRCKI